MINLLQFIRPENIPTYVISLLALLVALSSAIFTYKNYKINEGPEWRLNKINDSLWQLERNRRKRVAFIGLAISPSYIGVTTPSLVESNFKGLLLTKGDTIKFKIDPREVKNLETVKLVVYFKPAIFKALNKNSYSKELIKEIRHYEPKDEFLEWHRSQFVNRNEPTPTLFIKTVKMAKKIIFKQKIKVLRIRVWRSDII